MKKQVLKVMLGAIIFEVVLVCLFILMGNFNSVSAKALGSGLIIFCYSIPCLNYSKISDNEKYRSISIAGVSVAFCAALLTILRLWDILKLSSFLFKIDISLTILTVALSIISLVLSYVYVNDLFERFKKVCVILVSLLSFLYIVIVLLEMNPQGLFLRLLWVINVLTIGSYLCTAVLAKIYKKEMAIQNYNQYTQDIQDTATNQQANPNYTKTTNQNNNVPLNNAMPEGNQVNSTMAQNQNLNVPLSNYVAPPNPMPNQNQNNNSNLNN